MLSGLVFFALSPLGLPEGMRCAVHAALPQGYASDLGEKPGLRQARLNLGGFRWLNRATDTPASPWRFTG